MKVILTGATGYIGGGVLKRCLDHPSITSIVALCRKDLDIKHPKLEVVIQKDFSTYEPSILAKLEGAEACIWALGSYSAGRDVHVDLPVAGINAFAPVFEKNAQKFRFVYLSGALCERNQDRSLWFMPGARKMRGEVETRMVEFEEKHSATWRSTVVRPAAVTNSDFPLGYVVPFMTIPLDELAAAMVEAAVKESDLQTIENGELRKRGRTALDASK